MKHDTPILTLVTGNAGKVREFSRLLEMPLGQKKLDLVEIQAIDVEEVARQKAAEAYERVQCPVLVDDTGIVVTAWNGLPGALTSWFLDSVGCPGVLRMAESFDDRSASVITALGLGHAEGVEVFVARVAGSLADEARGSEGFGYDPIFVPDGESKTYAEMAPAEKDRFSMRRLAADKLRESGVLEGL